MRRQRQRRIGALLAKEIEDLRGSPGLFLPAVITGLIAIMLPFAVAIALPALSGEALSDSSDFHVAIEMCGISRPRALSSRAPSRQCYFNVSSSCSSSRRSPAQCDRRARRGGRETGAHARTAARHTLTTFELLAAKVLGALPGLALVTVGFLLYLGGLRWRRPGVYWTLLAPRPAECSCSPARLAGRAPAHRLRVGPRQRRPERPADRALVIMPISALMVAEFAGFVDLTAGIDRDIESARRDQRH